MERAGMGSSRPGGVGGVGQDEVDGQLMFEEKGSETRTRVSETRRMGGGKRVGNGGVSCKSDRGRALLWECCGGLAGRWWDDTG